MTVITIVNQSLTHSHYVEAAGSHGPHRMFEWLAIRFDLGNRGSLHHESVARRPSPVAQLLGEAPFVRYVDKHKVGYMPDRQSTPGGVGCEDPPPHESLLSLTIRWRWSWRWTPDDCNKTELRK